MNKFNTKKETDDNRLNHQIQYETISNSIFFSLLFFFFSFIERRLEQKSKWTVNEMKIFHRNQYQLNEFVCLTVKSMNWWQRERERESLFSVQESDRLMKKFNSLDTRRNSFCSQVNLLTEFQIRLRILEKQRYELEEQLQRLQVNIEQSNVNEQADWFSFALVII